MENSFSKPYQELFSFARKNFDLEAMENIFKELCLEIGLPDPQTQDEAAREQVREKAAEQADIAIGKAVAERMNLRSKQNSDANGMIGKKV